MFKITRFQLILYHYYCIFNLIVTQILTHVRVSKFDCTPPPPPHTHTEYPYREHFVTEKQNIDSMYFSKILGLPKTILREHYVKNCMCEITIMYYCTSAH